MSAHHAPELPYCRNCHFTLATPRPVYCGHCGQETDLHPPSVREMFTEYLGHYVAFDGPLWRTLWALICLPGHLTNAYFHGQRRRYVLPLRVYLSASFIFFVGWALLPQGPTQVVETDPPAATEAGKPVTVRVPPNMSPASAAAQAEAMSREASAAGKVKFSSKLNECDPAQPASCNKGELWLDGLFKKIQSMTWEQLKARASALAPYAMLAMQPVFAALLLLMFAGSGRRYAEHFVFSLHSHSLWFLALLVAMAARLEGWMMLAVFGHGLMAMRRVYGLGWWGATWRGVLLSALYFLLLVSVAMTLVALIAATA
ncbi:hypothetical protein J2X20_000531 [Pelomonas saccharophila]|uniref:DUF3667 domain-containing protein n=1 Tax=Roseateles saccharophilus TaxID=304 RepID=A0ABU1YGD1_ROSSA|nr:DUF3667 domain-containing protein [Roseateles saccharophilus]MDR7267902.1 hypothetical protein [Roseateles saccharophilus]